MAKTRNRQCAHLWAAQSAQSGEGYGHFYFEGQTIYSYGPHFPIASFTDRFDEEGERIVLFTTRGYSNTTSKHKSYALQALRGLPHRVLHVESALPGCEADHVSNVAGYIARYQEAIGKASRAMKYVEHHLSDASALADDCATYCQAFGLPIPELGTPESQERARSIHQAFELAERERQRRNREERAVEFEEAARRWRAGASWQDSDLSRFPDFPTLLRLRGYRIETSRGAVVPASVAPYLWDLVCRVRRSAEPCAMGMRIGDFELREVRKDGSLVIGCHTLEYPELERMARELGYISEEAVCA